jgi:hypothetical protein
MIEMMDELVPNDFFVAFWRHSLHCGEKGNGKSIGKRHKA